MLRLVGYETIHSRPFHETLRGFSSLSGTYSLSSKRPLMILFSSNSSFTLIYVCMLRFKVRDKTRIRMSKYFLWEEVEVLRELRFFSDILPRTSFHIIFCSYKNVLLSCQVGLIDKTISKRSTFDSFYKESHTIHFDTSDVKSLKYFYQRFSYRIKTFAFN